MKFSQKKDRKLCQLCGKRPNLFSTDGKKYKRDKQHDLCRQCHKSLSDSEWQERNARPASKPTFHASCCGVLGLDRSRS